MPYVRKGKTIYKRVGGKLKKKQTCGSVAKAKAAMRLLHGVHRGWKPTGRRRRRR